MEYKTRDIFVFILELSKKKKIATFYIRSVVEVQ